jgi:hypothetical protein
MQGRNGKSRKLTRKEGRKMKKEWRGLLAGWQLLLKMELGLADKVTFPIEDYVITGRVTLWSQQVLAGHKPARQEDVRLWIRKVGEHPVRAHVFRSTHGRPLYPGQDTIWVACSCEWCPPGWMPEPETRTYHEVHGEWQACHDRRYGIMEGDLLEEACPQMRTFLVGIGYEKDYVAEDDVEGFLAFLNNLEAHVADWEVEDIFNQSQVK